MTTVYEDETVCAQKVNVAGHEMLMVTVYHDGEAIQRIIPYASIASSMVVEVTA